MDIFLSVIISAVCLILGAIIGYLAAHSKNTSLTTQAKMQQDRIEAMRQRMQERDDNINNLSQERTTLLARRDVLESQVQTLTGDIEEQKQLFDDQLARLEEQMQQAEQRHEEQLRQTEQRYNDLMQKAEERQKESEQRQASLIREQINSASETILKKRAEELSADNQEQMAAILTPLHEHLRQMREAVERSDREHTTSMERLDASIKANLKQAKEVGERADKLAQALMSENKTQGNFGELRLRTILENMGLEEGVQFEEQTTLRDDKGQAFTGEDSGQRMVPDIILHFPDERDVVIDSKMSLKAFEEYFNTDDENVKAEALKRHVASVRAHVKELAQKKYNRYVRQGHSRLDFVVMYVYSESALQLALSNDSTLWNEAYEQGVVISGSQNLYMMLRVLEMTWRQVRQAENQEEIMNTANELVSRVQLFYERLIAVDEQLIKTCKAFDQLKTSTSPSGKSIITSARKLLKFGAQENPKSKQRLPRSTESTETPETPEDLEP